MLVRIVACLSATALLGGAAAARSDQAGVRAKGTVRAIAVLGPRVAGSANELRAARIVRARFARLGLRPVVQRVPLPRGGSSCNLVTGRTRGRTGDRVGRLDTAKLSAAIRLTVRAVRAATD